MDVVAEAYLVGIIGPADRRFVETPQLGGGAIKVLNIDEEHKRVSFLFRFDPGLDLPRHSHDCAALALTIEGEWEYDEGRVPVGAFAYEPVGSEHTPRSPTGSVLFVTFFGTSETLLTYHLADGTTLPITLDIFRALESECRIQ